MSTFKTPTRDNIDKAVFNLKDPNRKTKEYPLNTKVEVLFPGMKKFKKGIIRKELYGYCFYYTDCTGQNTFRQMGIDHTILVDGKLWDN